MQSAQLQCYLTRPAAQAGRSVPLQRWRAFSSVPLRQPAAFSSHRDLSARQAKAKESEEQSKTDEDEGRYPERNAWTGGWAGGEKGVQAFVAEFENEPTPSQKREVKKAAEKDPSIVKVNFQGKKVEARRVAQDETAKSAIYIGKKKLAADDSAPQFLVDDERKYPSRDKLGIVGGFAGGERGVQQYVEKGEVEIADQGRRQYSPLVFAIIVAVFGTAGGLFLTNVETVGEEIYETAEKAGLSGAAATVTSQRSALLSGLDPKSKLAIEAALAVIGVGALLYFGRKTAGSLANNIREGFFSLTKLAAFWAIVLFAAKFVIEN